MALIKSIPTPFGVPAVYWNIGARAEDFKGGGVEVTLYGYASEDARRENAQPLHVGKVNLVGKDYRPDMTRAGLYEQIVEIAPEFRDAESDE